MPTGGTEECLASIATTLRQVSEALDTLWRDAVVTGDAERLVELGDASYGLHLAIVALDDGAAERRALVA